MSLNNFLKKAQEKRQAIGQFNFCTIEQLQGIALATREENYPVICGTSQGESVFLGLEEAVSLVSVIRKKQGIDLFLNYDHGKDPEVLKKAIDMGYDMVHFDGSELSFEENVKITKQIVSYAEKHNVLVEGELARIGGASTMHKGKAEKSTLTSVEKIVKFIKETGVHAIALDIGNVHGVYSEMPHLHHSRISDVLSLADCFIVLHGGSGIEEEEIRKAISKGVVKININTELRFAWREAVYRFLSENPQEIAPYRILARGREAVQQKVREKINIFKNA